MSPPVYLRWTGPRPRPRAETGSRPRVRRSDLMSIAQPRAAVRPYGHEIGSERARLGEEDPADVFASGRHALRVRDTDAWSTTTSALASRPTTLLPSISRRAPPAEGTGRPD